MGRSVQFERRRLLYTALDRDFYSRTRFFAAAALTNAVFARLFGLLPKRSFVDVYCLLSDVGSVLERANLTFAQNMARQSRSGSALDRCLVRREQRLLQHFLNTRRDCVESNWEHTHRQLNGLLNEHHMTAFFSRCFTRSRQYSRVLANLRCELAEALDFADESHRVHIGLEVIRSIRVRAAEGSGHLDI